MFIKPFSVSAELLREVAIEVEARKENAGQGAVLALRRLFVERLKVYKIGD